MLPPASGPAKMKPSRSGINTERVSRTSGPVGPVIGTGDGHVVAVLLRSEMSVFVPRETNIVRSSALTVGTEPLVPVSPVTVVAPV